MAHRISSLLRTIVPLALAAALMIGFSPAEAVAATKTPTAEQTVEARGLKVVAYAKALKGRPYRYGASGPGAFDCSGLTGYVYKKAHVTLPRTANAQYHKARKLAASEVRPGDLVFWVSGGRAYHVGIYAGGGKVWHAPKPGDHVKLADIFSRSQVRFGRIG
ncbi:MULTISPECIES: C40 family peptidase [Actinoplanes]|uniref:C40 family peptidase n=1 Tax=Actinoplanes TaxID=1865 RepID=UPI000695F5FA|nr:MULTISPECIES: C40 family peptidase [Actinoplanes]GLY03821.1 glycoside hydrolase [Actinoplanes sp. NBRC 101535]